MQDENESFLFLNGHSLLRMVSRLRPASLGNGTALHIDSDPINQHREQCDIFNLTDPITHPVTILLSKQPSHEAVCDLGAQDKRHLGLVVEGCDLGNGCMFTGIISPNSSENGCDGSRVGPRSRKQLDRNYALSSSEAAGRVRCRTRLGRKEGYASQLGDT